MGYSYRSMATRQIADIEGTAPYPFYVPELTVASSTVIQFDVTTPTCQKYLPFNSITIINNGEADLIVYPNQETTTYFIVPKGTIFPLKNVPLWAVKLTNASATTTITANKIILLCERQGITPDTFIRAVSKNIFVQALMGDSNV
jgi:hypothetical protein